MDTPVSSHNAPSCPAQGRPQVPQASLNFFTSILPQVSIIWSGTENGSGGYICPWLYLRIFN